jgi:hypothetical protein
MQFVLRKLLNYVSPSVHASYPGPLEKMIVRRTKRGKIPYYHYPLDVPRWVPADRDQHTRPDDAVLGLVVDETAYALPWWVMSCGGAASSSGRRTRSRTTASWATAWCSSITAA